MARRRPKIMERDENAAAFPTEGDAVGLEALEADQAQGGAQERESPGSPTRSEEISDDEIARRAYERYQQRGGAHGYDQDDWYEAEREVRGSKTRNQ